MGDEINKSKRIRGVYRGSVTKAVNQVGDIIREEEIQNENRNKLVALKNNIIDKLGKIKEMDKKIENLLIEEEGEAFELELNDVLQYHEPFYELFVEIEEKLSIKDETVSRSGIFSATRRNEYAPENDENTSGFNRNFNPALQIDGQVQNLQENPIRNMRMNHNGNVRLPVVNIEPFDGEPLNYPSFINSFDEIIEKNDSLATVEKFYYLRGLLRGKAKTTIEGFTLTEENYKEALGLLKERFGDKKLFMICSNLRVSFLDVNISKDSM